MANTLTNVLPKIIASGLLALRKRAVFPRLVNGDYALDARQKGNTVDVPVPVPQTASNVTPGPVPPTPADTTPDSVPIPLDQWKKTNFHLTDKELQEIAYRDNFIPGQVTEAFEALGTECNSFIRGKMGVFAGVVTQPASNRPFQNTTNAPLTIQQLIAVAGHNRIPLGGRRIVLDPTNEGDAVALDWFRAADASGSTETIREAVIGHRFGIDWAMDQQAGAAYTNVVGTGFDVDNGAGYPAGTKSIVLDGGTGAVTAGASVSFTGHNAQYNVVTGFAAAGGTMVIGGRGLQEAVIDAEEMTVIDNGAGAVTQIPFFHRDAVAFVNRPVAIEQELMNATGNMIRTIQDPVSGLIIRLELSRQYKQWVWELDMLYGAATIQPELGVLINY